MFCRTAEGSKRYEIPDKTHGDDVSVLLSAVCGFTFLVRCVVFTFLVRCVWFYFLSARVFFSFSHARHFSHVIPEVF